MSARKLRRGRKKYGVEDEAGNTPPAAPSKSSAQIQREIDEVLARKPGAGLVQGSTSAQSCLLKADARKQALLEDAIEAVYNRKGSEDLTIAEACEAVRELLPSGNYWSRADVSDKRIATTIKHQIPYWF